jgi:hypothetical protein
LLNGQVFELFFKGIQTRKLPSALKIANGAEAGTCSFVRPPENSDFKKPWEHSTGVASFNMDYIIPEENIAYVSKSDLLKRINDAKKS